MPVATTPALERVARVLAGQKLSSNAGGEEPHASSAVEMEWIDCQDSARAVLRTLREPDGAMAAAGDVVVWERMIAVALGLPPGATSEPWVPPEPCTDPFHEGP
ncbi:MAG TPA: hypothetical protein VF503_18335 [Sphingobium sp.]|uniref:hypothetical protein n=1 Tax=Sphingobium sp. TaxID=1912891 RepID=UPI002ED008A8